jgi:excisionase family DNA binding protein
MGDVIRFPQHRGQAERWLNKRQAANHLGVSVSWVEKRAADSKLPFYRVGGLNLYKASELDEWVKSQAG